MTDRELLELAAKAHGFIDDQTTDDDEDQIGLHRNGQGIYYVVHKFGWRNWNPLADDGDALRLAVKLRIDIGFHGKDGMYAQSQAHLGECQGSGGEFDCGLDDYALTRRSIVEAAAEIGSLKP